MGIVLKQSFLNSIVLVLGFALGALNVLFLYTSFLSESYFGLVTFLTSAANILLPITVLGMQHAVVKFFSSYKSEEERDRFMSLSVLMPIVIAAPASILITVFYESILTYLSKENQLIDNYAYLIFILALLMGYFELFFAWSRVQFKTVYGTIIRELFARLGAFVLLFLVYFEVLSPEQFIYALVFVYALRCLLMAIYALYLYTPKFSLKLPYNSKEVLLFCVYIFLSGSAATILLEIDKTMIPQFYELEEVAFYGVGVYIALVIGIPSRAMQQIVNPMTAKALNRDDRGLVQQLYTDSSFYLLMIGGLLFLCININIESIYELIGKPAYQIGIPVVLIISSVELVKLFLGNANSILTNSKFYKVFFYVALAMAIGVVILNKLFIPRLGIAGAAWATFAVVVISAGIKIVFLSLKMNFSLSIGRSLKLLGIIVSLFVAFKYFPIWASPLIDIILKSILIALSYFIALRILGLSPDLNSLKNSFSEKSK